MREQQAAFAQELRRALPQAQIEYQYGVLFNGLAVRLSDQQDWRKLGALPGVIAVSLEKEHHLALNYSAPQIGAPALWNALGGTEKAGGGVKIAIIDSGIWPGSSFFNPRSFSYPVGFPKGDVRYTTTKVIAARAYFRPNDPPADGDPTTPIDAHGHGTHVAGIARRQRRYCHAQRRDFGHRPAGLADEL